MSTKRRILDTAREMFNHHGLKYVTARSISKELSISLGSFSYHFKDKSLIIKTLYQEMLQEIGEVATSVPMDGRSILVYLETHRLIYYIQEKYKFFYLNLFEILTQHPEIKEVFLKNIQQERQMAELLVKRFISSGVMKADTSNYAIDRIINVGQILNNFWAVDAEIMPPKEERAQLIHYMKICCGLMEPYLEREALKEYRNYFEELKWEDVPISWE